MGTRSPCVLAAERRKPGFMDDGAVFNCELAAAGPCLIDGVRLPADVWDIKGPSERTRLQGESARVVWGGLSG